MEPSTLTWRALTTADMPALTRTYAAVEAVDRTDEHYSEQDVGEEMQDGETLAALAPDGEVVAFARLHGSPDQARLDGAGVPEARGRANGTTRSAGRTGTRSPNTGDPLRPTRSAGRTRSRGCERSSRT